LTFYYFLLLYSLKENENFYFIKKVHYICLATLAIFHNVSRSAELKESFREMKSLQIVKRFTTFNSPEIRSLSYFFIANVGNNEDDVELVDASRTIPFLIEILNEAMKNSNRAYKGADVEFPAYIIIESLHKLAVEDDNRLNVTFISILLCLFYLFLLLLKLDI
jgi:hypothetical protein